MEQDTTYACVEYELGEEQRLEGMCRVCASSGCELTPVFDSTGQSEGIVDLINNHLPILVCSILLKFSCYYFCTLCNSYFHFIIWFR